MIHQEESELRGELGAALASPSRNDGATRTGAHARAEAVDLRAAAVVGLERTLAHSELRDLWNGSPALVAQRKSDAGRPEHGSPLQDIYCKRK